VICRRGPGRRLLSTRVRIRGLDAVDLDGGVADVVVRGRRVLAVDLRARYAVFVCGRLDDGLLRVLTGGRADREVHVVARLQAAPRQVDARVRIDEVGDPDRVRCDRERRIVRRLIRRIVRG